MLSRSDPREDNKTDLVLTSVVNLRGKETAEA